MQSETSRESNPELAAENKKPRLVFVANSMYSNFLSGGDIHTFNMAASALRDGYRVHFLAGHALAAELERHRLPVTVGLTDDAILPPRDFNSLSGQLSLLGNYFGRLRGTLRHLSEIQPEDIVYANSEFWWDSWPLIRSQARRKVMYLGMDCPTLQEIILRTRPDVKAIRLPSVHYWFSQQVALRLFRRCRQKRLTYMHVNQRPRLFRMGYREADLVFVANGVDLKQAEAVPEQKKIYDAAWTGRVHQQKGIEDLLATLAFLSEQIKDFRAVMIGNLKHSLGPMVAARGLKNKIDFSGYVPEEEKFRLLKCSRVFLMPSRYESWGIVIGEALACRLPVVAYDIEAYRPVFGDLLHYVKPFDTEDFQRAATEEVQKTRSGQKRLDESQVARFIHDNSWEAVGNRFLGAVKSLASEELSSLP